MGEETSLTISNLKDGKMLALAIEDGADLATMKPTYSTEMTWTYKPTCDGKVTLINNIDAPFHVLNVTYDANLKTIMNEDGLFAFNSKKGFKWASEVKFLKPELVTPWKRYQWDIVRLPAARAQF